MAVANKKKAQSLINLAAQEARNFQAAAARLEALRDAFVAQAVNPAGTALEGNTAAANAWIAAVRSVADDPLAGALIAAEVPSHRGLALEV